MQCKKAKAEGNRLSSDEDAGQPSEQIVQVSALTRTPDTHQGKCFMFMVPCPAPLENLTSYSSEEIDTDESGTLSFEEFEKGYYENKDLHELCPRCFVLPHLLSSEHQERGFDQGWFFKRFI